MTFKPPKTFNHTMKRSIRSSTQPIPKSPKMYRRLGENDLVLLVESERAYIETLPAQFQTCKDKVIAILDKLPKSPQDLASEAPASASDA
jgi:hypothetical protein